MEADFFATDACELYRHPDEPIFFFLIVGGEGPPPINFNHNLFSPPDRIPNYADCRRNPSPAVVLCPAMVSLSIPSPTRLLWSDVVIMLTDKKKWSCYSFFFGARSN